MAKKDIRIVFMGTPDIAGEILETLILNGYNIVGVIAQPDKEVGRKKIVTPVPSKIIASKYNIPTYQPLKIRLDYDFLKEINPDLIITLAYGQIVPTGVLDIPRLGCINLHGSLLPKYRGAAPMQYALLNGDKVTGFTLMEMTKDMDAGKMYAKKEIAIDKDDNYSSLLVKMTKCAKELILETLDDYILGKLPGEPQNEAQVSFAPTIKAEEERIDINSSIENIFNKIRALAETPGAYLFLENEKIKIYKAEIVSYNHQENPFEVVKADKSGLYISFKDGLLSIIELQKAGKNKMNYKDFINGNRTLLGKKIS